MSKRLGESSEYLHAIRGPSCIRKRTVAEKAIGDSLIHVRKESEAEYRRTCQYRVKHRFSGPARTKLTMKVYGSGSSP